MLPLVSHCGECMDTLFPKIRMVCSVIKDSIHIHQAMLPERMSFTYVEVTG